MGGSFLTPYLGIRRLPVGVCLVDYMSDCNSGGTT